MLRPHAGRALLGLIALAAISLASLVSASDDCPGALQNLGFEQSFSCWANGGVDSTAVVGSEGPADFPVYADTGITVEPYRDDKHARVGMPKRIAESQNSGATFVEQTFVADGPEVRFATRLFSFEHRGDDQIVFFLDDLAAGSPQSFPVTGAVIPMPGGGSASCTRTPCVLTIDVGKRGDFLDSGWREISIGGLTVGRAYKLRYELDSSANSGHPTWAYFDGDDNKPPVACFQFNPGSVPGTTSFEGDAFAFSASCSSDPNGDALTYLWTVSGATIETSSSSGPIFLVQFPTEDPSARVCLEVSDGEATSTTCTGSLATASLTVGNAAPLAGCVGLQVLAGSQVDLRCRYADPGWQDTHSVQLGVGGSSGAPTLHYTENLPALATGLALRKVMAPASSGAGSATVTDNSGAATSVGFPVTVLTQAQLDALESAGSNDTISSASPFEVGWTRHARLDTPIDIDVYRVLKGNQPLPVGSQLEINLQAGADYDVVVLAKSPNATTTPFANGTFPDAPLQDSGFQHFGFQHFGFQHFGFQHFGFQHFGFQHFGFQHFGFQHFGFQHFPLTTSVFASLQLANIPLNAFAAPPAGPGLDSTAISLGELGTYILGASEGEPAVLKGFSANPGSTKDRILFEVAPGETDHYVFVVSHQRAYSPQPYALTMEASTPQPLADAIGAPSCTHPPLVSGPDATTTTREVYRPAGAPLALCVGQEERRRAIHGVFDESGDGQDDFVQAMIPFFDATQCLYVSLPSTAYDAADQNTCDAELQDQVAQDLAGLVHEQIAANPTIENVVLLGSFNVLPPCAPPGLEEVGNESLYTLDLLQRSGAKLTTLLAAGRNLSDACYADLTPQLNNGHPLYVEDLPIGRLVETPAQIVAKARHAVANDFEIPISTALTTGYDFFADVAEQIDQDLATKLPGVERRTLISDFWAADELRCEWLGQPTNACPVPRQPDLTSLEAHMTSYGLLAAQDFNFPLPPQDFTFLGSPEAKGNLPGAVFSLGCHSALSSPNEDALPREFLPFEVGEDFAEDATLWVGPPTFGVGHTDTYELGHEGLMLEVTRQLTQAMAAGTPISVGQAVMAAKQVKKSVQFPTVDPYAEKALASTAVMGVPQLKLVPGPATLAALQALGESLATPAITSAPTPLPNLALTMIRGGSATTTTHTSDLVTFSDGTTAHRNDEHSCGIFARPLLGCVTPALLRAPDPLPVRTVLLRGGSYADLPNVAIANTNVTTEWTEPGSQPRPKTCLTANYPGEIATPNRQEDGRLTIVVNGAQFRCELPESQRGVVDPVGTLRTYSALTFEEITPISAAFANVAALPQVLRQDLIGDAATGTVTAKLCATDDSGMREVTLLRYLDGQITEFRLTSLPPCSVDTPWEISVPDGVDAFVRLAYCNNGGLCRIKANKSLLLHALPTKILNTSVNGLGGVTTLTVEIEGFEGVGAEAVVSVEWGDGSPTQYVPLFNSDGTPTDVLTIDENGDATVKIDHVFVGSGPFHVQVELISSTATGFDEATIAACGDTPLDTNLASADWVSCSIDNAGTKLDLRVGTLGAIDDANVQYRVRLPLTGDLVKFTKGKCTASISGAACKVTKTSANQLRFQFETRSIWSGAAPLELNFETQSGVPGSPSEGRPDFMPDASNFTILP